MITKQAYAKINTYLDVISKRDDGFHDILSVMRRVSLADNVRMEIFDSSETGINLSVKGDDLPCDERNLVYRAAVKFLEKFKICSKINIEIEKKIPIGAGLAGGSADAAATLRALNRIFNLASEEQLLEIAAEIGSDVPFCLLGGTALCEGRGEIITPIKSPKNVHFVVAIRKE
jgi:4-diphosphocytidyl-2-C-methyl-D-erythritol kinase